jgi:glycosyltransferase involved in cell wall biosynthesis
MKKKTLYFDDVIEGHHLEYLHHLYIKAGDKKLEHSVFVVHPDFLKVKNKFHWPDFSNVTLLLIDDLEIVKLKRWTVFRSFVLCILLKKYIKVHNPTNIFLISLMSFIPFITLFVNKKVRFSGIVYLIYLYRWDKANTITRIFDSIKYLVFSNFKIFENIYLLNDKIAPKYLNKKFKTDVFKYLPDPFIPINEDKIRNLRDEFLVAKDKIICLHFGAMTERKGTLDILRAICLAEKEVIKNYTFVFAGRVLLDINESFYDLLLQAQLKTQIIVFDEFVDYNFIGCLCLTSDLILIPYKNTEQSSGVIGYAAQFSVPVVAPKHGLLGKLVRNYKLGYLLTETNAEGLSKFLSINQNIKKINSIYTNERTVDSFSNHIN